MTETSFNGLPTLRMETKIGNAMKVAFSLNVLSGDWSTFDCRKKGKSVTSDQSAPVKSSQIKAYTV